MAKKVEIIGHDATVQISPERTQTEIDLNGSYIKFSGKKIKITIEEVLE